MFYALDGNILCSLDRMVKDIVGNKLDRGYVSAKQSKIFGEGLTQAPLGQVGRRVLQYVGPAHLPVLITSLNNGQLTRAITLRRLQVSPSSLTARMAFGWTREAILLPSASATMALP